mgnify:CR=1 FL=1
MKKTEDKQDKVEQELEKKSNLSIINLVNYLVEKAQTNGVSDIHIDPGLNKVRVRFRQDGVLQELYELPKEIHGEVIARIKVLSKLRTDEHQATQDGRWRHMFEDGKNFVDIRVSIVPTYHGENCVMRLLSDKASNYTLENLGFSESDRNKIAKAMRQTSGMILATGPTGSGKTTTLYTLVKMLNSPEVSIVTIEDPIEYAIEDIEQIQVNSKAALTFANGLRRREGGGRDGKRRSEHRSYWTLATFSTSHKRRSDYPTQTSRHGSRRILGGFNCKHCYRSETCKKNM